jgi:hypothetical protein
MQSYLSYNEIKKWLETGEDGTREDGTREDGTREDGTGEDCAREYGTREDGTGEDGIEDGNNHFDVFDINQDSELIEDPEDSAALGMAICLILVQNLLF